MKHIPHIKAVMTPFPYSIEDSAPLEQAGAQMREHGIRHLPVMKDGRLAGIVTDRDIHLLQQNLELAGDVELRVGEVAASEAYVVDLNESLDNVLVHMARHHIDCALVTRKDKLVGLFTVTDACRSFAGYLREQFFPGSGDDAA